MCVVVDCVDVVVGMLYWYFLLKVYLLVLVLGWEFSCIDVKIDCFVVVGVIFF